MIQLLTLCGKWMIISFNLPFNGKKDCVIKESVANKTDIYLHLFWGNSTIKCGLVPPIICIILMGDAFAIHRKSVDVD